MKTAKYKTLNDKFIEIEYDENEPCILCGLPVLAASMGGTAICPWCDMGIYRDGTRWDLNDCMNEFVRKQRAQEHIPSKDAVDVV